MLSFESLMGNVGGIGIQPALGRVADLSGYGISMAVGGVISAIALPFLWLSRRQNAPADTRKSDEDAADEGAAAPAA